MEGFVSKYKAFLVNCLFPVIFTLHLISRGYMKRFRLLFICLPVVCLAACTNRPTLFEQIPPSHSGIHFNNRITENDSINPLDVVNIYNGGGVGIAVLKNDDRPDIYLIGNMVANRLYLNKGDFTFEDITDKAGIDG